MALSSQFESSRELLYMETRQMLETLDLADDGLQPVRIEQVQAWLLVAFYELARASYRRASISAGRAFRLVQLAHLHEIDSPGGSFDEGDAVATEERRRTFWVAYCLDRLICMRSRGPLTLTEEVVSRLSFILLFRHTASDDPHHSCRSTDNCQLTVCDDRYAHGSRPRTWLSKAAIPYRGVSYQKPSPRVTTLSSLRLWNQW